MDKIRTIIALPFMVVGLIFILIAEIISGEPFL